MREHLQQRLKEKHTGPGSVHDLSNSSKCSSSRNSETIGNAELDFLVNYIEGNQIKKPSNPKKAAKKARQKQKKVCNCVFNCSFHLPSKIAKMIFYCLFSHFPCQ